MEPGVKFQPVDDLISVYIENVTQHLTMWIDLIKVVFALASHRILLQNTSSEAIPGDNIY